MLKVKVEWMTNQMEKTMMEMLLNILKFDLKLKMASLSWQIK